MSWAPTAELYPGIDIDNEHIHSLDIDVGMAGQRQWEMVFTRILAERKALERKKKANNFDKRH